MRFSTILALPVFLAVSVLAGQNCKCQDANGQYNAETSDCCVRLHGSYWEYQSHQCSKNGLNSGAFVECCQLKGIGGAYCWN